MNCGILQNSFTKRRKTLNYHLRYRHLMNSRLNCVFHLTVFDQSEVFRSVVRRVDSMSVALLFAQAVNTAVNIKLFFDKIKFFLFWTNRRTIQLIVFPNFIFQISSWFYANVQ